MADQGQGAMSPSERGKAYGEVRAEPGFNPTSPAHLSELLRILLAGRPDASGLDLGVGLAGMFTPGGKAKGAVPRNMNVLSRHRPPMGGAPDLNLEMTPNYFPGRQSGLGTQPLGNIPRESRSGRAPWLSEPDRLPSLVPEFGTGRAPMTPAGAPKPQGTPRGLSDYEARRLMAWPPEKLASQMFDAAPTPPPFGSPLPQRTLTPNPLDRPFGVAEAGLAPKPAARSPQPDPAELGPVSVHHRPGQSGGTVGGYDFKFGLQPKHKFKYEKFTDAEMSNLDEALEAGLEPVAQRQPGKEGFGGGTKGGDRKSAAFKAKAAERQRAKLTLPPHFDVMPPMGPPQVERPLSDLNEVLTSASKRLPPGSGEYRPPR